MCRKGGPVFPVPRSCPTSHLPIMPLSSGLPFPGFRALGSLLEGLPEAPGWPLWISRSSSSPTLGLELTFKKEKKRRGGARPPGVQPRARAGGLLSDRQVAAPARVGVGPARRALAEQLLTFPRSRSGTAGASDPPPRGCGGNADAPPGPGR